MWFYKEGELISEKSQKEMMERLINEAGERFGSSIRKVLLLPPDITRYHSGAGKITNMLYHILGSNCHIDIIPTLGQHVASKIISGKSSLLYAGVIFQPKGII